MSRCFEFLEDLKEDSETVQKNPRKPRLVNGRYYGAKTKIVKEMCKFILEYCENRKYHKIIDCFCGSGSVSIEFHKQTDVPVFASDHFRCLIVTLLALQNGWVPPSSVTKKEFEDLKTQEDNPLKSLVHVFSSTSGCLFKNRQKQKANITLSKISRTAHLKTALLQGIQIYECKYDSWETSENCLIYCDPPYISSKKTWPLNYKGFDHAKFWQWVRKMSRKNIVIVSEYEAPDDFKVIWEKPVNSFNWNHLYTRTEKLFELRAVADSLPMESSSPNILNQVMESSIS